MKKIIFIISISVVFLFIVVLVVSMLLEKFDYNVKSTNIGKEIIFPMATNEAITKNTKKEYNIPSIETQIKQKTALVYSEPILTDYSIVSKLGFDVNNYKLWGEEQRFYKTFGRDSQKNLIIDKYGCFDYDSGEEDTCFEMTLTDHDCLQIAKQFLEEYGLFSDRLATKWSTNETVLSDGKSEEKVVGKDINFFASVDGDFENEGNARITVEINGNGEVCSVVYNLRQYSQVNEVKLISLQQALDRFESGKAYVMVENPSSKLNFESVCLSYWSQETNPKNLVVQPVYIFQGTSTTSTGESEPFVITVQANKFE